jgi:hypothetical protein
MSGEMAKLVKISQTPGTNRVSPAALICNTNYRAISTQYTGSAPDRDFIDYLGVDILRIALSIRLDYGDEGNGTIIGRYKLRSRAA